MKTNFCFLLYIFLLSILVACGYEKNLSRSNYNSKFSSENSYSDQYLDDCYSFKNSKKDNSTIDREPRETVIVFAHYKDLLGQIVYKFLGEFQNSKKETNKYKWVFNLKKTKVYL